MNNVQYVDGDLISYTDGAPTVAPIFPRHCIRETFREGPAPGCVQGCWLKVWTFHYSDGTMEQLKQVIEK